MKKLVAITVIGVLALGIISISTFSDQFADAGSRKKIHFTQTINHPKSVRDMKIINYH